MSKVLVLTTDEELKKMMQEGLVFPRGELFSSPEEALAALDIEYYPLLVCESPLKGKDMRAFLEGARGRNNHDAVLLLASGNPADQEENLFNEGAVQGLLKKPFSPWQIRSAVQEILSQLGQDREMIRLSREDRKEKQIPLVGLGGDLSEPFKIIKSAAAGGRGLFLQGEPGTGKDILAQAYHKYSRNRRYPLGSLPCSALMAEERNNIPPSDRRFSRIFKEMASGGILYLEEMEHFSPKMEELLLPELEKIIIGKAPEGEGIPALILMASSRLSLDELESKGIVSRRFRETWRPETVIIPSLRERKRDFGRLVSYFIEKTALELGRVPPRLHRGSIQKLSQYRWPGNVAELEGVIKRGVVLTDPGSDLIPEGVFDFLFLGNPLPGGPEYQQAVQILARRLLQGEGSLREIESHVMETIVALSGGSIVRAVEQSGIPKDRFYRYYKKKGSLKP